MSATTSAKASWNASTSMFVGSLNRRCMPSLADANIAWLPTNQSTYLTLVHARSRRRIIPIGTPGRMIEMNHKITVIRDHRVIEGKTADPPPIAECDVLRNSRTVRRTFIRHFDVEREAALRHCVAGIENLRHYFVAKIQGLAGNP